MKQTLKLASILLALCASAFAGVSVSSPGNGSTVGTPTHFVASASSSSSITHMTIYVDYNKVWGADTNKIDAYVSLSGGNHKAVVQAWDSAGNVLKSSTIYFTVGSSSSSSSSNTVDGITISSPSDGATVSSPVQVTATASASSGISRTYIYVDYNVAYKTSGGKVSTSLSLSSGWHKLVVQSWDNNGNVHKNGIKVNVSGSSTSSSSSSTSISSTAKNYYNIDQMSGWQSCDSCSGAGGAGASIPHYLSQYISSPSLDGKSAKFSVSGSSPYASALWWKQLGAYGSASHFVYDFYYYIKNPDASQALEFDANQSVNGRKYIFGTECNFKETHTWRVYDTPNHTWRDTGITCSKPTAYKWHHVTLEFSRSSGYVKFVSVTVDGSKHYFNRSYYSKSSSVNELNVAVQLDGNSSMTDYSLWVDKIKLSAW